MFFFENMFNIDEVIMKTFGCEEEKVKYFKIEFIFIIFTVILIGINYLNQNCSDLFYQGVVEYGKIHPIRIRLVVLGAIWIVILGLLILNFGNKTILTIILQLIMIVIIVIVVYYTIKNEKE